MKSLFLIGLVISLFSCAFTVGAEEISYKSQRDKKEVTITAKVYRLDKISPTIIYVHGCSGIDGTYRDWVTKLNSWGYNVVIPDSFRNRWVSHACNKNDNNSVKAYHRLEDLIATSIWIKSQKWGSEKIGAIGFSQGGIAVLNAAADGGSEFRLWADVNTVKDLDDPKNLKPIYENTVLSVVVAYYPFCTTQQDKTKIPAQIHVGINDDGTPPVWCTTLMESNPLITYYPYENTYHSFDVLGIDGVSRFGWKNQFNKTSAILAELRTKAFFNAYMN